MVKKEINVKATQDAIIDAVRSAPFSHVDIPGLRAKITSEKDLLEACEFARAEPVYY